MGIFTSDLLKGSIAIVSGGGTGLGKQMAIELGRAGASIVIAGRRSEVLKEAEVDFQKEGIPILSVQTDIRKPDEVDNLIQRAVDTYGQVNILVNNAGGQFPMRAEELSVNGWNAVVNNNLNGTFYMTRAFGRQVIAQGTGGVITNIIINSVHRGIPGIAHSVAARSGVYGMTKTLALEWAKHHIRVNAVGPGLFITQGFSEEMEEAADKDFVTRTQQAVPLGRTGRPEELGWLVTYLSSPAAAYITGEYINIDGGNALAGGINFFPA
ncbi:SDR family oxidoreductase [Alicyclobacillus tolerans]|uniref:SDR family oxidoreductase n=1 Tax=Alicyclobacillus tolerans TaxID=90970 RepID=UPI001F22B67B|nr:SDR family oxidoreductase [Alicyclobacillus tolerans]MCF8565476.1 SDR family oxidoreductase [Alicyclobacillus tolerans]